MSNSDLTVNLRIKALSAGADPSNNWAACLGTDGQGWQYQFDGGWENDHKKTFKFPSDNDFIVNLSNQNNTDGTFYIAEVHVWNIETDLTDGTPSINSLSDWIEGGAIPGHPGENYPTNLTEVNLGVIQASGLWGYFTVKVRKQDGTADSIICDPRWDED